VNWGKKTDPEEANKIKAADLHRIQTNAVSRMWITLTDQQEQELQAWVTNSKRIAESKRWQVLNEIVSDAV
jgi:succinate dehydrogenase flavin-adding protein (antitoxin of CptAB toxin-antitoxin module)